MGPCKRASSSTGGRSPASGGGAGRRCAAGGTAEGTPAASAASCTAAPGRDRDLAAQVLRSRQAARARTHTLPGKTHPDRRPERGGPSVCMTTFRPGPSPRTDAQSCHRHTGPSGSSTTHDSLGAHTDQKALLELTRDQHTSQSTSPRCSSPPPAPTVPSIHSPHSNALTMSLPGRVFLGSPQLSFQQPESHRAACDL